MGDCLTDEMLTPELLTKPRKWDKELFREYKLMLDYNFSYLQETISAFKVRKEVTKAQNKSEAIDDARKYESKARKCRRKYDEQVVKLREILECDTSTTTECDTQTDSPKLKTGRGRVKRGYANVGTREPLQSTATTFGEHNRDHQPEAPLQLKKVNAREKIAEYKERLDQRENDLEFGNGSSAFDRRLELSGVDRHSQLERRINDAVADQHKLSNVANHDESEHELIVEDHAEKPPRLEDELTASENEEIDEGKNDEEAEESVNDEAEEIEEKTTEDKNEKRSKTEEIVKKEIGQEEQKVDEEKSEIDSPITMNTSEHQSEEKDDEPVEEEKVEEIDFVSAIKIEEEEYGSPITVPTSEMESGEKKEEKNEEELKQPILDYTCKEDPTTEDTPSSPRNPSSPGDGNEADGDSDVSYDTELRLESEVKRGKWRKANRRAWLNKWGAILA